MSETVKKAWAEFAALYGVFSTTAQIIARRKFEKGGIEDVEFDFDAGEMVITIYHRQDYDYVRVTLDELAQEFEKAKAGKR